MWITFSVLKGRTGIIHLITINIMNKEEFKKEIKRIIELVKVCPANLQEKCFEVLLNHTLLKEGSVGATKRETQDDSSKDVDLPTVPEEIKKRVKFFAGQYKLEENTIFDVFVINESGDVSIEVSDLRAKKVRQQQKRLALLIGTKHQFMEGSFNVPIDELRETCVMYSAYDAGNFAANLKKFKDIFAGFKPGATNKLSPKGKNEAAELIKELSS